MAKALPYIFSAFGYGTWFFFASWMLVATVWAYFFLPETKGKTLDEFDVILYVTNAFIICERLTFVVGTCRTGRDQSMLAASSLGTRTTWLSTRRRGMPRWMALSPTHYRKYLHLNTNLSLHDIPTLFVHVEFMSAFGARTGALRKVYEGCEQELVTLTGSLYVLIV